MKINVKIFVVCILSVFSCVYTHNGMVKQILRQELQKKMFSKKRKAVLKGLLWCVNFVERDERFNFIFSDYVTMLYELSNNKNDRFIRSIAIQLIKNAEKRMRNQFADVFPPTREAKWDLISVLPIFYTYGLDIKPYSTLYRANFPKSNEPDYDQTLQKAIVGRNYDLLLDYFVDYSFVDLAYKMLPKNMFLLPTNKYKNVIKKCSKLPFIFSIKDEDGFHDQNYYATHIICALTCYGSQPLVRTDFSEHVFKYLLRNFHSVRYVVDDIDLLGEYLQCLKVYGLQHKQKVLEAERYLISKQLPDGSWRNQEDADDDAYDIFHPIWTSIVALHVGSRYVEH